MSIAGLLKARKSAWRDILDPFHKMKFCVLIATIKHWYIGGRKNSFTKIFFFLGGGGGGSYPPPPPPPPHHPTG